MTCLLLPYPDVTKSPFSKMADMTTPNVPPSSPQRNRDSNRNQSNRRRGAPGPNTSTNSNSQTQRGGRGPARGGRGQGRGGRGGAPSRAQGGRQWDKRAHADGEHASGEPPDRNLRGTGTSGDRLTGDANRTEGESKPKELAASGDATDATDDSEICFICASKVEHMSVAPCNHRTCHICSLRLRALYKTKACAHCRVSSCGVSSVDNRYTDICCICIDRIELCCVYR